MANNGMAWQFTGMANSVVLGKIVYLCAYLKSLPQFKLILINWVNLIKLDKHIVKLTKFIL